MTKKGYVYMMTNPKDTVIYTGVTSDLWRRVNQHKEKAVEGFTKKYNITKLVWFEEYSTVMEAIVAEKKIKAGSRAKKIALIKSVNYEFKDLVR